MKAIISLTVPEGKRLIARAVVRMPEVRRALEEGKVLLKPGTTVSAVAEELLGMPLPISGRITPRGLLGAKNPAPGRYILIESSQWRKVGTEELRDVVGGLGERDAVVIGANLIDAQGGAAMMAGGPMGGNGGRIITGIMLEGVPVIVAAGLEKLVPGTVQDAVLAAGRKGVDLSMGMAVGLMPILGKVVTEVEAVKILSLVECQVIGRGGIEGAEGGVHMMVSGAPEAVESIFRLALSLKGATTSVEAEALIACEGASRQCSEHYACIYKSPKLLARYQS